MTSQHFDDGWDNWGEDWNENSTNNNNKNLLNSQQISQHNQQYIHQPQPINLNAPVYSPLAYQQQPSQASSQSIPPPAPSQSPFMNPQQSHQTYSGNAVNFFNPPQNTSSSNNNSPFPPIQTPQFEKVKNYQSGKINTVQFSNSNLLPPPPPSSSSAQTFSSIEQTTTSVSSTSFPLPPPPATAYSSNIQNQNAFDSNIQGSAMSQHHMQPSSLQAFDSNYNPVTSSSYHQNFPQWTDQRSMLHIQQQPSSGNELGGFNNSWQQSSQNHNSYINNQMPQSSLNDWQHSTSIQQSSGASFFNNYADSDQKEDHNKTTMFNAPPSSSSSSSNQFLQQQQPPKFENIENVQTPASEPLVQSMASTPNSTPLYVSTPSNINQLSERQIFESNYPENRERLDELPSVPTIDRHSYLVTGQLSQDHSPVPTSVASQQQNQEHTLNDSLPPPGLSRMVVGEPENNQQQIPASRNDVRMVTGNEMTPTSYLNYQRQADGEVSPSPSNIGPIRPLLQQQNQQQQQMFNQQQIPPPPMQSSQQNVENDLQQSFNISDRNLYLVAGESDVNSQRVIPGVESDNSINAPMSVINPLQNLHIEDDEDFVNISVTTQHRNVDGDGMDEQQNQRSIETEQREEDIEGANDNNAIVNVNPSLSIPQPALENINAIIINDQESDIREDIEGANDYSDVLPKQQQNFPPQPNESQDEEKKKSIEGGSKKQKPEISSEDSELRELEKNARLNMRRSKKYDDSNDSESDHGGRQRNKYDDRHKRSSGGGRDKMSREEYDRYRRREKERRSGGRDVGRSKRNDDTDGSRYDSRRRTDDEDEDRGRRQRRSNRSRRDDDREGNGDDKDRKKDKNRERKKYYDDERRRTRDRDAYYAGGRPGSQNASDREFERYPRTRGAGSGYEGYGYPYGYDPNYNYNSYYQQQQYFETLRRTNPQAYEWYAKYYSGMMQHPQMQTSSTVDPTESIRSGYSSSNEKERANTSRQFLPGGNVSNPLGSLNSSFIDNTNDYHSLQSYHGVGKDFNQPYASLNLNNQTYGYDMYGDLRVKTATTTAVAPADVPKFHCQHGIVSLTNGILTTIDSFNTENSYLVKLQNVPIYDRTRRLFQSYPGPLVRGLSHKKTVIEFCEDKLKQNSHLEESSRASYNLLWSYLVLMLRQNGTYTEADISELLMKNSEEFKSLHEINETKSNSNNIVTQEEEDHDENNTDVSESEENNSSERNSNTISQSQDASTSMFTEKNVLDKFKDYLLYGNINDALDYATDNNLWGHALFLASKVDRRQHANVMLKFANKLSYNDPLQTLYQIMSGRMPACVTSIDDKFGDWRPHLAMIISNCTDKPELVKRSIITLGDTLLARGDIYGSHFCYLLMDPQFTDYSDTSMANGKIALLGTTVQKPFKEFASNESIIMTEVYEYARSLSTENYFIASLQKYKFLLASSILDYGNQLKCLLYMEQISKCIVQQPQLFDSTFIKKVYFLADKLKFYDPVMEKSYEDNFNNNEAIEDPKWLQDLSVVLQNNNFENSVSQQYDLQQPNIAVSTYAPTEMYNPIDLQQPPIFDPMSSQHQTPTHIATGSLATNQTYEEHDSHQYNYDQQNQTSNNQIHATSSNFNQDGSFGIQYQQQEHNNSYSYNGSIQNDNNSQSNLIQDNKQQQQAQHNYMQPTYDPNYQQSDYSNNYNSWDQPKPTITMGNVSKFDDSSTQDNNDSVVQNDSKEEKKSPIKSKDDKKKAVQDTKSSGSGGGWFSSFFGKAKSTQMKLPDDKNPSIVWDEAAKKWVNKDEDPAEAESFKPPPKMDDMMRKNSYTSQNMPQFQQPLMNNQMLMQNQQMHQQQQQMQQQPQQMAINQVPMQNTNVQQPQQSVPQYSQQAQQQPSQNIASEQVPQMPAAPNMFKMQKGRNLKKSYVDILGNAGHTVSQPKELAPQMDMQFFNPQAQPQGMQFYNPNDFQ